MNIASRIARRAIYGSTRGLTKFGVRSFSKPIVPPGRYNMIQQKAHGLVDYIRETEALIFSHSEYRWATVWIWSSSAGAVVVMFYCIWNSVARDPEVRIRPHKKAWQISEDSIAKGEKYRGAFSWIPVRDNGSRVEFMRKVCREGLGVAGFDEPGQIGWEENPIPKLDDEEEE